MGRVRDQPTQLRKERQKQRNTKHNTFATHCNTCFIYFICVPGPGPGPWALGLGPRNFDAPLQRFGTALTKRRRTQALTKRRRAQAVI